MGGTRLAPYTGGEEEYLGADDAPDAAPCGDDRDLTSATTGMPCEPGGTPPPRAPTMNCCIKSPTGDVAAILCAHQPFPDLTTRCPVVGPHWEKRLSVAQLRHYVEVVLPRLVSSVLPQYVACSDRRMPRNTNGIAGGEGECQRTLIWLE